MRYYNIPIEKVLEEFNTSEQGLNYLEALDRLEKNGENKLEEAKKESLFSKFISEFKDVMIIILLISSVFSLALAIFNNQSIFDSVVILLIVIINAILGFTQEIKADKAIDALKKLSVSKVKVRRDGNVTVIDSKNVVVGDIIVLEAGDKVVADARIIKEKSLKIDESSLTGESNYVKKTNKVIDGVVDLSLQNNMIFMGTEVIYGKVEAVVVSVGMNTEFGKVAESLKSEEDEETPLQKKITNMSKILSELVFIIIMVMFIIGIARGMMLKDIVMLSISLAVAAIPEGLPAVITVILSLGMNSLASKNAVVRKMSAVEALGSTEVICSDKTGTITQNKMTVVEVYYDTLTTINKLDENNPLFDAMILCNDAFLDNKKYVGDPTEVALLESLDKIKDIEKTRNEMPRIDEIPFDSERKMMSTINRVGDFKYLYTKGSFDSIIKKCKYYISNNEIVILTNDKIEELKRIEKEESNKAYRILSYAYKKVDGEIEENDLVFIGLTAMIDPPRLNVSESIALCHEAHIRPVMITGDSLPTAYSIAKKIGIIESEEDAITGLELDHMNEEQFMDAVLKYNVYARVSPKNKLDIVEALKKHGYIVAMTGDGVNDAPALKAASIGVGMGITGTEVSKSVSDIVLLDDSFSTIVDAIGEGRRIYDNIRNVLVYLLAGNIAEILIVFIGMILGFQIFMPIQILYLNLITDSLPAISLAFEPAGSDIMRRDIRKNKSFITPFISSKLITSAILKTIAVLAIYYAGLNMYGIDIAKTMSFLALILLEMSYSFSCKNLKQNVFSTSFLCNKYLNMSMILLIFVQIILFNTGLKDIFYIMSLNIYQVLYVVLMILSVFILDELLKIILNKIFKD